MQRFFLPPATLAGDEVRIAGETAHQISRVLRMEPGDQVCLLDGLGYEYLATLKSVHRDEVTADVTGKKPGSGEPAIKITLYISLLNKADKFEWALQKCTEIGAADFVAIHAARSVADIPGPARIERWRRIVQEAAEQSGRSLMPFLTNMATLAQVLKQEAGMLKGEAASGHLVVMPTMGAEYALGEAIHARGRSPETMSIIVGPEGGFTEDEVKAARDAGITPVTLGPRILRAETAAVAALTMALYELGEMK